MSLSPRIKGASYLYAKMKAVVDAEHFKRETDEEYEDTEGNVLDRRTFEDLARQGLL